MNINIDLLLSLLGWSTVINLGLLLYWFVAFVFAHDLLYRIHSRWFMLSVERFDAIHYGGMGLYKLAIVVFNFVPWLVLMLLVD